MKGEGTREKGKNGFFESSQEQEDYVGTEALAYQ